MITNPEEIHDFLLEAARSQSEFYTRDGRPRVCCRGRIDDVLRRLDEALYILNPGFFLVDVDTQAPHVISAVERRLSSALGVEYVPFYLTAKGANFVFSAPGAEPAQMRRYLEPHLRDYSEFVDLNVIQPRFIRVPYSSAWPGLRRNVVPVPPGHTVEEAVRYSYLSFGSRADPDWAFPRPVVVDASVLEEVSRIEVGAGVVPRRDYGFVPVYPPCVLSVIEECLENHYLSHHKRLFLASFIIAAVHDPRLQDDFIHWVMGHCEDYNPRETQRHIDYLRRRGPYVFSCRRLRDIGACPYERQAACPYYKVLWGYYGTGGYYYG